MDRARPVLIPRASLSRALRDPLAAALPEAAPADLDPVAGQQGDDRLGLALGPALHVPADVQPGEGGPALSQAVPRHLRHVWLWLRRPAARLGRPGLRWRHRRG